MDLLKCFEVWRNGFMKKPAVIATLCVIFFSCTVPIIADRPPIIIIPGLQRSQLWGTSDSLLCHVPTTPKLLWMGLRSILCLHELSLQFDQTTGVFLDKSGVNVSVPGFGYTNTVECTDDEELLCDASLSKQLLYFRNFVKYFVEKGYTRGKDIRAAPYDWRYAANADRNIAYFAKLKNLVEETYVMNSNQSVSLVAHSMGGPMSLYFLNKVVTSAWKSQYIANYITLSGAFAGGTEPLGSVISGIAPVGASPLLVYLGNLIGRAVLWKIERTFQSLYWMSPDPDVFGSQPQVETPDRTYTAGEYESLYRDFLRKPEGFRMYQTTVGLNDYSFPQVPTYCFYGSNMSTVETYKYVLNNPTIVPTASMGPGDGTVNRVSLEVCLKWKTVADGSTNPHFHSRAFPGVSHHEMVTAGSVIDAVASAVMSGPASSQDEGTPAQSGGRVAGEL